MKANSHSVSRRVLLGRALLVGASALVLSSCGGLIGPPEAPKLYLLKPAVPDLASGPRAAWQLSVGMPEASDALDNERIAITQGDTMDYYANAAWQDHVPVLVQSALIDAFDSSGRINGVARGRAGLRAEYQLQSEILDFQARYDQPDGIPTAVVRIRAKLINSSGRRIVAELTAAQETPATQNSIPAAVEALNAACGAAIAQIVNWALQAPPPAAD